MDIYSDDCVSILVRLIDLNEEQQRDCDKRLECICEAFDNFHLSVTFMDFPGMGNYCKVLNDKDESFMKKPVFLGKGKEREIPQEIERYLTSNDIDEDEYDVYQSITLKMVPARLAKCWRNANKRKGTNYNLFYFVHRYFNEPAVNLANQEKLFLDDLEKI